MSNELGLTEKILTTFHLTSSERKLLPDETVKLSIIKAVINKKLQNFGWFPEKRGPDLPFAGGLIEKLADGK